MCGCLSHTPTGDLAHNPGMCPDWESNQRPLVCRLALDPQSHTSQGKTFIPMRILKDYLLPRIPCLQILLNRLYMFFCNVLGFKIFFLKDYFYYFHVQRTEQCNLAQLSGLCLFQLGSARHQLWTQDIAAPVVAYCHPLCYFNWSR